MKGIRVQPVGCVLTGVHYRVSLSDGIVGNGQLHAPCMPEGSRVLQILVPTHTGKRGVRCRQTKPGPASLGSWTFPCLGSVVEALAHLGQETHADNGAREDQQGQAREDGNHQGAILSESAPEPLFDRWGRGGCHRLMPGANAMTRGVRRSGGSGPSAFSRGRWSPSRLIPWL